MKFNPTKILILVIIFNVVALAGYYFLFQYIKTQSKEVFSLASTIDLGQQKDSRLSSLRSVTKDTADKRQQLEALLLSGDTEIPFIEQIEGLAKSGGLEVKTNSVSSGASVNSFGIKTFQMQIETIGSWNNTLYFLDQIENLPYDIHMQGVYISKSSTSSSWVATFDIGVTENS